MTKAMTMTPDEVKDHWKSWADEWDVNLRATTKTWTIKALEIDALARAFRSIMGDKKDFTVLEPGCGNGANCLELAKLFPEARFDGFDYVSEMVEAAEKNRQEQKDVADKTSFFLGDVTALDDISDVDESYDIIFTDRCLINLTELETQKKAIAELTGKLKPGGWLLMIENSKQTYDQQNECRVNLGLEARTPASFNLFFDEDVIVPHIESCGLELTGVDDFGSLHDLVLYALAPSTNGGEVDYGHPMVEAATVLSLKSQGAPPQAAFGTYGQNRLYLCRKT